MADASPVRFGILSTANATKNVIPALLASPLATVVAVASRELEPAVAFAARNKIARAYGTYDELLADAEIDAVYIPLPVRLHTEWVVKACEAKKHVLCEKPLALAPADIDVMEAAARRNGVVVAEAVMSLHLAQSLRVRQLVADGAIGEVRAMRGAFHFLRTRDGYRNGPIAEGGGSLWDVGCYPLALARFVLGEEPCECVGRAALSADGSFDESFFGTVLFRGGTVGLQLSSSFAAPTNMSFEVFGSRGSILLRNPFKATPADRIALSVLDASGAIVTSEVNPEDVSSHVYQAQVDNFCAAVRGSAAPLLSLGFSKGNVEAILALHASAASAAKL